LHVSYPSQSFFFPHGRRRDFFLHGPINLSLTQVCHRLRNILGVWSCCSTRLLSLLAACGPTRRAPKFSLGLVAGDTAKLHDFKDTKDGIAKPAKDNAFNGIF
jgi:hypothetical protein